jgi:hypothetical protein
MFLLKRLQSERDSRLCKVVAGGHTGRAACRRISVDRREMEGGLGPWGRPIVAVRNGCLCLGENLAQGLERDAGGRESHGAGPDKTGTRMKLMTVPAERGA